MAKARIEIINDPKGPSAPLSQSQEQRRAFVAEYAKRNPVKYEVKKAALEAWIAQA